jgi:hypothetical protein
MRFAPAHTVSPAGEDERHDVFNPNCSTEIRVVRKSQGRKTVYLCGEINVSGKVE